MDKTEGATTGGSRTPALAIIVALVVGGGLGIALTHASAGVRNDALAVAGPIGTLWLDALQMTIVPLVAGLLFTGVLRTSRAAQAGPVARHTLTLFAIVLLVSALAGALLTPLLLDVLPIPGGARSALGGGAATSLGTIPSAADFIVSLIPANVFAALGQSAMLPVMVFTLLFALAALRLPRAQRDLFEALFDGLSQAMLTIIGWVLAVAPLGVFAIGLRMGASEGAGLIGLLAHYIVIVSLIGGVVLACAYLLPVVVLRRNAAAFARAVLPAQAMGLSTQSSLATLPAMLDSARRLNLRESTADFVLPMAVSVFKATSPAMNLAVTAYVARWSGITLGPAEIAAGVVVAYLVSFGAPGLPGTISYVASIAPIALAMGVPLAPLAVLVAVEVLPDLMRTLGNVTMNVAIAETVDGLRKDETA